MKKLFLALLFMLPMAAHASSCELTIDSTDQMTFSKKKLTVPAGCETVSLTLTHSGQFAKDMMGHNWVLTETDHVQDVASAAAAAGIANDFVPEDDRVLAATKLIGGGEEATVEFSVADLKDKDLTFFCSFPGHIGLMKGKFVFE